jgi:hypothetical protein
MKDDVIRVGLLLGVIVLAFAVGPALANASMRKHQSPEPSDSKK